jgi:hypothetical protein
VPLVSALNYVAGLLDGITVPGAAGLSGPLVTLITPYDPDESGEARAYVWGGNGRENRLAFPRNTGPATPAGWKNEYHDVDIFLVWFDSESDTEIDTSFPALLDAVMDALRTSYPNPAQVTDPYTGRVTQMVNCGEQMTYTYVPPHSTADQRTLRFDAKITMPLLEFIQA